MPPLVLLLVPLPLVPLVPEVVVLAAPARVRILRIITSVIAFPKIRSPALNHVVTVVAVHASEHRCGRRRKRSRAGLRWPAGNARNPVDYGVISLAESLITLHTPPTPLPLVLSAGAPM